MGLLAAAVAAVVPAAQPASASAPPTVPPGSELGTPIPTDFVSLVDDTGTITVVVPGSWNDVDPAPDGEMPSIEASPDRDGFLGSFDVAGMTYRADSYQADTTLPHEPWGQWRAVTPRSPSRTTTVSSSAPT